VAGEYLDMALVDGKQTMVGAVTDLPTITRMFPMRMHKGTVKALSTDELIVDTKEAEARGLHAGSSVEIQLAQGAPHTMTVVGIFSSDTFNG